MITLTPAASAKVREIMETENKSEWNLRMGIRDGGGCGSSYILGFDQNHTEEDQVFLQDGIRLVCDPHSFHHLDGTEIDFSDNPERSGFIIKNPNAGHSCGCGGSCCD
jgi:iron-sulfur cluster assembly protein